MGKSDPHAAWRESAAIDRRSRAEREERICRAYLANPGIDMWAMAERFSTSVGRIGQVLRKNKIRLPSDDEADAQQGEEEAA